MPVRYSYRFFGLCLKLDNLYVLFRGVLNRFSFMAKLLNASSLSECIAVSEGCELNSRCALHSRCLFCKSQVQLMALCWGFKCCYEGDNSKMSKDWATMLQWHSAAGVPVWFDLSSALLKHLAKLKCTVQRRRTDWASFKSLPLCNSTEKCLVFTLILDTIHRGY